MSKIRRRGLRRRPEGGWPLDGLFVGVATLRTAREQFKQSREEPESQPRAWDLALWSGVTPQGSADALDRLHRSGLVTIASPRTRWRAQRFQLDREHPLYAPLARLFDAEETLARTQARGSKSSAAELMQ